MKNHEIKIDRRIYDRVPTNFIFEYSDSDGHRFYAEYLCNLGIGGMRIEALDPIEPETKLIISLPLKPVLKIEGIVKSTFKDGHRYQIDIQFDNPTEEQQSGLKEIMKSHEIKIDRRKYDRAPANFIIEYSYGHRFYAEYLHDLGIGGMCIEVLDPIEPETKLIITLPLKPVIKIEGIVKWSRKDRHRYQIGIQFDNPTMEQQSGLKEIMKSLFWEVSQASGI
ncbi:MAG: PilZ domain-containing protein [Deltaproteobacteria bacterium]|nr:PilZ domain-containing protein [Deltaproteobacteria bacterium]